MKEREFRYHRRLQKAIDYIEINLKEDLALVEVSEQAHTSVFHFHRLFRAFLGRSLSEYIRERRLYSAARELVETDASVTDIALEYGYSAPESFLRAFRATYGMTPSAFRRNGILPPFMNKVNLIEGAVFGAEGRYVMNPEIINRNPIRIIGTRMTTSHGSCHEDVNGFWDELRKEDAIPGSRDPGAIEAVFGVCYGACSGCACTGKPSAHKRSGEESFSYFVGYQAAEGTAAPKNSFEATVPGGTYAVFSVKNSQLRETMDHIYASWLPASGYDLGGSPVVERYGADWRKAGDAVMEIWFPVQSSEQA